MSDLTGQRRWMDRADRPVWRCVLLCLGSVGAAALLAPLAGWMAGSKGLLALAVATAACLAGAVGGEIAGAIFVKRSEALFRLLVGMLLRLAVPLAVLVVLVMRAHELVAAGAAYYLIVQYMVVLAVESWLAVRQAQPDGAD